MVADGNRPGNVSLESGVAYQEIAGSRIRIDIGRRRSRVLGWRRRTIPTYLSVRRDHVALVDEEVDETSFERVPRLQVAVQRALQGHVVLGVVFDVCPDAFAKLPNFRRVLRQVIVQQPRQVAGALLGDVGVGSPPRRASPAVVARREQQVTRIRAIVFAAGLCDAKKFE